MKDKIEDLMREVCDRTAFGPAFFEEHLALVVEHAGHLATLLGANCETVSPPPPTEPTASARPDDRT
jgi:hypothetical protein